MAAFAEVIYSQETNYHRTGGSNNHLHLGFPSGWTREQVAAYGRKIAREFGVRVSGQCRANNVRPPGGAANSLHYERNGCRALDLVGPDARLLKLEQWANAQSSIPDAPAGAGIGGADVTSVGLLPDSVGQFFATLGDSRLWVRVGLVAGGVLLFVGGVALVVVDVGPSAGRVIDIAKKVVR